MDYNSLLELVKKRRSIRQFKQDPIPDDYVDKIIEVARWAPSAANLQPWEFIVVKKPEFKVGIVQFIEEATALFPRLEATREAWQRPSRSGPPVSSPAGFHIAPVFILLLKDTRTRVGLPMAIQFSHEVWSSMFDSSLAMAYVYMTLAATTLGLASQWVTAASDSKAQCLIKDLLGIPVELEIYDMMAIGYPAGEPRPRLVRDREEMVHYDHCGEGAFRTDEQIKDFIIEKINFTGSQIAAEEAK